MNLGITGPNTIPTIDLNIYAIVIKNYRGSGKPYNKHFLKISSQKENRFKFYPPQSQNFASKKAKKSKVTVKKTNSRYKKR